MSDLLTRAKAALDGTTEGPWAWFGDNHSLYLATTHSGRRHVMGFDRMGMQGAQPTFNDDMQIKPASDLVRFVVGDGNAKGFKEGREDASVYRYNISEIDHPDARLIAAAPVLIRDLIAEVERLRGVMEPFSKMAGEMFANNWNDDGVAVSLVTKDGRMMLTFKEFRAVRTALDNNGERE